MYAYGWAINLWLIPRKIRRLVLFDHPDNVEFLVFKGAVFQGAMSGADAFFSRPMRKLKELLSWKPWPVSRMLCCAIFQFIMAGG